MVYSHSRWHSKQRINEVFIQLCEDFKEPEKAVQTILDSLVAEMEQYTITQVSIPTLWRSLKMLWNWYWSFSYMRCDYSITVMLS
jgi:hypothetical protein